MTNFLIFLCGMFTGGTIATVIVCLFVAVRERSE